MFLRIWPRFGIKRGAEEDDNCAILGALWVIWVEAAIFFEGSLVGLSKERKRREMKLTSKSTDMDLYMNV